MTKEKTNLIKTLKDENLRAETHKYTQNLINNHKNRSLTVPTKNSNIKKEIENKILNEHKTEIKETNNNIVDNKSNISNGEENNKIKKKKKVKKKKKIKKKKSDKVENAENGQKYKLLTYQTLNQIINEKKEKEKENKIEDKKTENKSIVDKNIKKEKNKDENKIKSNNDKESEKINNTRRDLLNSLNNLQYNFDNLMEIGVHGNKILNNKKK